MGFGGLSKSQGAISKGFDQSWAGLEAIQSAFEQAQTSSMEGLHKSQDRLLYFQNDINLYGARLQREAAAEEANYMRVQSIEDYAASQYAQQRKAREVYLTAASQTTAYLNEGVDMMGSPLTVVAETRALGDLEIQLEERRAQAEAHLTRTKANRVEEGGLATFLMAENENIVNTAQQDIRQLSEKHSMQHGHMQQRLSMLSNKQSQKMNMEMQFQQQRQQARQAMFGGILSLGTTVLGSLMK